MTKDVFSVARSVWKHPLFDGKTFSEREAFLWMISAATWKPIDAQIRRHKVALKRGQFSHSIRFMAAKFGWKRAKIERFLRDLKTDMMIKTEIVQGQQVITICNYDHYQLQPGFDASKNRHNSRQFPDSFQTKKNKGNKGNNSLAAKIDDNGVQKTGQPDLDGLEKQLRLAAGDCIDPNAPNLFVLSAPLNWKAQGADLLLDILPAIKAIASRPRSSPIRDWSYFTNAVLEAVEQRKQGRPLKGPGGAPVETGVKIDWRDLGQADWLKLVKWYREYIDKYQNPDWKKWKDCNGPPPGHPECKAPKHILEEFGFK